MLVVVLVTKFTHGAWVAMRRAWWCFYVMMTAIRRHYDRVAVELAAAEEPARTATLPSRVHSIVLVSKIHKPTLRALAYAEPTRSDTLEALTVNVDPAGHARRCRRSGSERGIAVPLKVLDSPYREITRPIIEYVKSAAPQQPPRRGDASSSPSTWSATGTSTCCTTRARCGSRGGCCSHPG